MLSSETGRSKQPGQPACNQRARSTSSLSRRHVCLPCEEVPANTYVALGHLFASELGRLGFSLAGPPLATKWLARYAVQSPEAQKLADKIRPGDHRLIRWAALDDIEPRPLTGRELCEQSYPRIKLCSLSGQIGRSCAAVQLTADPAMAMAPLRPSMRLVALLAIIGPPAWYWSMPDILASRRDTL